MKLLIKTDNEEISKLKPRDIRNYIGSIVDKKYKDEVMWHKYSVPKIIYPKPFKQGFEIVNYTEDIEILEHIKKAIYKNKTITINGIKTKVIKARLKDEVLEVPKKGFFMYKSRTPMILSSNPIEYKIVYSAIKNESMDDLIMYINRRIKSDILHYLKNYLNFSMDMDLNIIAKSVNVRLVDFKSGEKKRQAAFLEIVSNYSLPRFVGYKIGLGWGEMISTIDTKF